MEEIYGYERLWLLTESRKRKEKEEMARREVEKNG